MFLFLSHPPGFSGWLVQSVSSMKESREEAAVDPGDGACKGRHVTRSLESRSTSGFRQSLQLTVLGVNPSFSQSFHFCEESSGREGAELQRKPMFLLLLEVSAFISWDSWRQTDAHKYSCIHTPTHMRTGANVYRERYIIHK